MILLSSAGNAGDTKVWGRKCYVRSCVDIEESDVARKDEGKSKRESFKCALEKNTE